MAQQPCRCAQSLPLLGQHRRSFSGHHDGLSDHLLRPAGAGGTSEYAHGGGKHATERSPPGARSGGLAFAFRFACEGAQKGGRDSLHCCFSLRVLGVPPAIRRGKTRVCTWCKFAFTNTSLQEQFLERGGKRTGVVTEHRTCKHSACGQPDYITIRYNTVHSFHLGAITAKIFSLHARAHVSDAAIRGGGGSLVRGPRHVQPAAAAPA